MISLIIAVGQNYELGFKNDLPWPRNKRDLNWFKDKTTNNVIVMGSNTWNSLGKMAPLPNRINVVVSSKNPENFPGAEYVIQGSLEEELITLESKYPNKEIFVIGGEQLYRSAAKYCQKFYVTRIYGNFEADTFFNIDNIIEHNLTWSMGYEDLCFEIWERK